MAAASGAGFGTSGVRGLVSAFTPELCGAYTLAFLSLAEPGPRRVLVGHDLRPSSPAIAAVCRAAARQAGFDAVHAGVLPTPALAFAAQCLGVPAIMVTGSHIPFDRNGLKFYHRHGEITKADEQSILSWRLGGMADIPVAELPPEPDPRPLSLYFERYRGAFGPSALSGLRIGVYEHSSAARDLLHALLAAMGATTVSLGRSGDFVAVDTEAVTAADRHNGVLWATEHRLDAIVATDGDADRPLVADERGAWLRGDLLGLICARELAAATVVTPVSSTTALEASRLFPHVLRTRIGSPHVIAGMQQAKHHPVVGFEANGGFLLGSGVTIEGRPLAALATRDAVLPILLVLRAARRRNVAISALMADLPSRHVFSDRLQDIDVEAARSIVTLRDSARGEIAGLLGDGSFPIQSIDRMDGLRVTFANGDVVHVRLSGNAPELRCYAESTTPGAAERLCGECLARLRPIVVRN